MYAMTRAPEFCLAVPKCSSTSGIVTKPFPKSGFTLCSEIKKEVVRSDKLCNILKILWTLLSETSRMSSANPWNCVYEVS